MDPQTIERAIMRCIDISVRLCELALAHVNSDRVEAAYRRSDLFDRRHGRRLDRGRVRLMSTKNPPMTISPRPRAPDGGCTERQPERASALDSGRGRIRRQVEDALERRRLARDLGEFD